MERPRAGSGTAFGGCGESTLRMFYPSPRSSQNLSATLKREKKTEGPKRKRGGRDVRVSRGEKRKKERRRMRPRKGEARKRKRQRAIINEARENLEGKKRAI